MSEKTAAGVHWSFWAVGAVALIWNVMGGMNFVMLMNTEAVAAMPETHRAIIEGRPAWATGALAIGVFGGGSAAFCFCSGSRLRTISSSRRYLAWS